MDEKLRERRRLAASRNKVLAERYPGAQLEASFNSSGSLVPFSWRRSPTADTNVCALGSSNQEQDAAVRDLVEHVRFSLPAERKGISQLSSSGQISECDIPL